MLGAVSNLSLQLGVVVCTISGFALLLAAIGHLVLRALGEGDLPTRDGAARLLRENPLQVSFVLLAYLLKPGLIALAGGMILILAGALEGLL